MKHTTPDTRPGTSHRNAAAALDTPFLDPLLVKHLNAPSEQLTPSSGFTLSVMDAIHQQATAPPPIAFPWRRVLPGAIAIPCALAAFALFVPAPTSSPTMHLQLPVAFTSAELVLSAIILIACLSIGTVAASFRLVGRTR